MFGLTRNYHPLDSRHPANRKVERTLRHRREVFRTAEKSRTLRHFLLPPDAKHAQSRLRALEGKSHLSEAQKSEAHYLEGRMTELTRRRVERDTIRNAPLLLKLFFAGPLSLYASLRGEGAIFGRKHQEKWNIRHVVLVTLALAGLILQSGGIKPATRSLTNFETLSLAQPITELTLPDIGTDPRPE